MTPSEKVANLIALATNAAATEEEARTAAMQAARLIAKHGLNESEELARLRARAERLEREERDRVARQRERELEDEQLRARMRTTSAILPTAEELMAAADRVRLGRPSGLPIMIKIF